jgi:hypothetical protein
VAAPIVADPECIRTLWRDQRESASRGVIRVHPRLVAIRVYNFDS